MQSSRHDSLICIYPCLEAVLYVHSQAKKIITFGALLGWDGRIRTYDLLVQSEAPYRLATSHWLFPNNTLNYSLKLKESL